MFDELLSVEPALGDGVVWLVPAVGLVPSVELLLAIEPEEVPVLPAVPVVPSVAPPVAAMPHGCPGASILPVVLELRPLPVVPCAVELGLEEPVFKLLGFEVL